MIVFTFNIANIKRNTAVLVRSSPSFVKKGAFAFITNRSSNAIVIAFGERNACLDNHSLTSYYIFS